MYEQDVIFVTKLEKSYDFFNVPFEFQILSNHAVWRTGYSWLTCSPGWPHEVMLSLPRAQGSLSLRCQ